MAKDWLMIAASTGGLTHGPNSTANRPFGGVLQSLSTEVQAQHQARAAYTVRYFAAYLATNTLNVAITARFRKNAADGTMTFSIGSATTGHFEDPSASDTLADGDRFNARFVSPAGSGTSSFRQISAVLEHATDDVPILTHGNQSGVTTGGLTNYVGLVGNALHRPTETDVQITFHISATLSRLRAYCETNGTTGTDTLRTRKNAANGGQTLSVTGTGEFEDTSGTDDVVDGDEVNYQIVAAGTSGNLNFSVIQVKCAATATFLGGAGTGSLSSTTTYNTLGGTLTWNTTEAFSQTRVRMDAVFENFFVNITVNSRASSATLYALRKNGATSALGASVPASTTGVVEDITDTVSVTSGDLINLGYIPGSGSGSITASILSVQQNTGSIAAAAAFQHYGRPHGERGQRQLTQLLAR